MIYVLRLVTGDEIVCDVESLDMTSDEIVVQDPMEIVSSDGSGAMYLRSSLMLSDEDYLIIPTSKIVYSYPPSEPLVRYYRLASMMYQDRVVPVVNEQLNKSSEVIEDAYFPQEDEEYEDAMNLLRDLLKNCKKRDLN